MATDIGAKMCILLVVILNFVIKDVTCDEKNSRILRNERCRLRETLVHVDKINNKYYPLIVKLHRCDGSCRRYPPSIKKCVAATSTYITVKVKRLSSFTEDKITLRNDTSCKCQCVEDETACSAETQIFDKRSCKCGCKPQYRSEHQACFAPFQWNPTTCGCSCNLNCGPLKDLDPKTCTCSCKINAYKKCAIKNRYLKPDTCQCMSYNDIERSTGKTDCGAFPKKWFGILIAAGIVMLLILVFDCILFAKKTGVLYQLLHCCGKAYKHKTEEWKMNSIEGARQRLSSESRNS